MIESDGRGQLILVGGIVVAFGLVALVLLLNAALFTENVSTRGLGPAPDEAQGYVAFTDRANNRMLRQEENIEYLSFGEAEKNAKRNVRRIDGAAEGQLLQRSGAFANVTVEKASKGAVLIQNNSTRSFTSLNDDGNWTLADGTRGIRNFTMTVDAGNLSSTNVNDAFTVRIKEDTGSDEWTAYVYRQGNNVVVNISGETCPSNTSTAVINWTEGTLDGCRFPYATDDTGTVLSGPYDFNFTNGTAAKGTYRVVVLNEGDQVEDSNFADAGNSESPRQYPTVYALELETVYETATVDYQTHLRIAPGEPPETRPPT